MSPEEVKKSVSKQNKDTAMQITRSHTPGQILFWKDGNAMQDNNRISQAAGSFLGPLWLEPHLHWEVHAPPTGGL